MQKEELYDIVAEPMGLSSLLRLATARAEVAREEETDVFAETVRPGKGES